jgi:hypothetical protein
MANWWQERPLRLVQTNLREIDARRDPREIVREVQEYGANAILFSVGGIVSFYPTKLCFQTPVPYLREHCALGQTPLYRGGGNSTDPVRDFVGEAIDEAHALGLRFIARLDLSKCHKHVYESHPEWFFRRADGLPQVYNGLYSTCVNGGYYREYAFEIMQEIRDRYDVDGFFFNMFGYHSRDYSGNDHGLCQCVNCQARFQQMFGHPLPPVEDPADPAYLDYAEFKHITSNQITQAIAAFIHRKPNTALVNFQVHMADVVRSESNSAVDRPLPMWQFSGSDNVMRVRGTYPQKPSSNAAVYFVDIPYRFVSVSPHLTALRLAQDLAHGGDIDLYVLGTLQQPDQIALGVAREIFQFAAKHEAAYRDLASLAKVCLIYPDRSYAYGKSSQEAYRGAFRLLVENHIPFDCAHDVILGENATTALARYDLLVLPDVACLSDAQLAAADDYVARGGNVLATGETALFDQLGRARPQFGLQCLGAERVQMARPAMRSAYFRVHNRAQVACLPESDLIFLDGTYLFVALREGADTTLTLVPPSTYGPPEKCFIDHVESDRPGIVWHRYGQGRTAYFPWHVDSLYYRHSSPGHQGAFLSALVALCPIRQVVTDANPQLEVALLSQGESAFLLNLVNASGHHGTAFFSPVPMHNLEFKIRLPRAVRTAISLQTGGQLAIWQEEGYTCLRVERVDLWDTVQLVC